MQEWRNGTVRSAEFQRTPSGDLPADRSEFWPTTQGGRRTRRKQQRETDAPLDDAPVHVILPRSAALIRRIWLPASAEKNLAPVIELELERELPLPREQVLTDWRVGARNRDRTKIEVIIAILWRSELERLVEALHRWKLRIASIAVAVDGVAAFNFSPRRARRSAGRLRLIDRILAISVGLLLLVYLGLVGAQWLYERRVIEESVANTSAPALRVERMQAQLATLRMPMTTLTNLMASPPSAEILTELTSAIPHDSWVQQLELRMTDADAYLVKLVAITPTATLLVDHLARTPHFQNVELQSAGPSLQTAGPDRAEIQTTWRKSPVAPRAGRGSS